MAFYMQISMQDDTRVIPHINVFECSISNERSYRQRLE